MWIIIVFKNTVLFEYSKIIETFIFLFQAKLMFNTSVGKKRYMLIGKLLENRHPDIADRLITEISADRPKENDLSLISGYFKNFCYYQNLNPDDYIGQLKKSDKVEMRRLYVSAMLHLYSPNSFYQPSDFITVPRGFGKAMSTFETIK